MMDTVTGTVFIVDDAREVRAALSRVLSAAGYQVHSFESAEQFLEEQDGEAPGCFDDARLFAAVDQALQLDFAARNERAIRREIEKRLKNLTPRERQVMDQVTRGRLNKQIAADLGIGEKTVKVHRARVMAKMDVRSVAELVQLASRVGAAQEVSLPVA